jgi:hypothetical protein
VLTLTVRCWPMRFGPVESMAIRAGATNVTVPPPCAVKAKEPPTFTLGSGTPLSVRPVKVCAPGVQA